MTKPVAVPMPYLVLRTKYPNIAAGLLEKAGLPVREEKHGNGPAHYSCIIDMVVLEIYPETER